MISIITSLYNSEKYLLRYQRYLIRVLEYLKRKNIRNEIIIIANESNEREKEILDNFFKTGFDIKITYVKRETLYASWNRGIKKSSGKAITFWNVDDIRFGRALINGYKKISTGADVVYFPFVSIWRHRYYPFVPIYRIRLVYPPKFSIKRNEDGMIGGPFFMINSDAITKAGYFDEQLKVVGDYDWFIKSGRSGVKFVRLLSVAGLYIHQGKTLSGGHTNYVHRVENQVLFKRYGLACKIETLSKEEEELFKSYRV